MIRSFAIAPAILLAAAAPQPSLEEGRSATAQLLAGESDKLLPRLGPNFLAALNGKAGLDAFSAAVTQQLGKEEEVLEERSFREGGATSYYRRSRFAALGDVTTFWMFDPQGLIQAGAVRPTQHPAPSPHLAYRTRAALRLPFARPAEGRWYVTWGGRDLIHNYHAASRDQRFAYDLLVTDGDRLFRTDGKTAEDYLCFGQPILAPAAGKVVAAVDGLPDNPPGRLDEANPGGNHVVIDHGNSEFSFLAHLQQGSVRPKPGDTVGAGAPIGKCGNSGRTTMPHLHYHLQNTAVFFDGEGLPPTFHDYHADGQPVESGEPVRGQHLEPRLR